MAKQGNPSSGLGSLVQVVRTFQLIWRLLNDSRVPFLIKLIIPAVIAYIVWPLDLIPDAIPILGQLDDIGIIFLGIRFFLQLCPADVVMEHRRAIAGSPREGGSDYVDASYRVMGEDDRK